MKNHFLVKLIRFLFQIHHSGVFLLLILSPILLKGQQNEIPRNGDSNTNTFFERLDSIFITSNYEDFSKELILISNKCDTCVDLYLSLVSKWADTTIIIIKEDIDSSYFLSAIENIKLLDDLNYNLVENKLKWRSSDKELNDLRCMFNRKLSKSLYMDIDKLYEMSKTPAKLSEAGDLVARVRFYRLKYFRNICFDRTIYDTYINKLNQASAAIEKTALDDKYKRIANSQPIWVKMGMSFDAYQEWWARKLTVGSDYLGGGCNDCGKKLQRGKRGGIYYFNRSGNKQYVPKN